MGKIGIIGGSGLYKMEGIKNVKEITVTTPFGKPSDKFILGRLEGKEVVFLPRHGLGHRISPSEINYLCEYLRDEEAGSRKNNFCYCLR